MSRVIQVICVLCLGALVAGCETTNSIPYKASTDNVVSMQRTFKSMGKTVNLGAITMAPGVDESPLCRLMGPVKVAPGKSLAEYIHDAFQEELFMAQVYDPAAPITITGEVQAISFSSVSPASWDIKMLVKSNRSAGYTVETHYEFDTSWTAYSACKNVADAFGPAVQDLLKKVVSNPGFAGLAGS